jgi:uncharacterized protein YndB with AHSA1/START domain
MAHRFEIDRTVELGASAEHVWQAIAMDPGIDRWSGVNRRGS